jgi:large repetitive protein
MRRWCYLVLGATLGTASWAGASAHAATAREEVALAPFAQLRAPTESAVAAARKPKRPKIFRHSDVRAEATSPQGAVVFYRSARVLGARSVSYSKRSGTRFRLGTTIVTITARNRAGVSRSRFKVTVADTTRPTFGSAADVTATPTGADGAAVAYGPIRATDRVDRSVSVVCSPAPGSVFPVGRTAVNCSARDDAGNSQTTSFTVIVLPAKPGRWSGTTAQGQTITFEVSSDGRQIVNLSYGFSAPCTPDGTITGSGEAAPITFASDGAFSVSGPRPVSGSVTGTTTSTVAGRFNNPVSAAGTFDEQVSLTSPAGYQCNSGAISWTASSVG